MDKLNVLRTSTLTLFEGMHQNSVLQIFLYRTFGRLGSMLYLRAGTRTMFSRSFLLYRTFGRLGSMLHLRSGTRTVFSRPFCSDRNVLSLPLPLLLLYVAVEQRTVDSVTGKTKSIFNLHTSLLLS